MVEEYTSNPEQSAQENENKFYIYPTKISRRILSYLGDLFICFIVSIFLFEIAVLPIGKLACNYQNTYSDYITKINTRYDVLYNKQVLFYDENSADTKYVYNTIYEYTADKYLQYYVTKDLTYKKYDVITNYWTINAVSPISFSDMVKKQLLAGTNNAFDKYFDAEFTVVDGKKNYTSIALKETYIDLFLAYYQPTNQISDKGKTEMQNFKDQFFQGSIFSIVNDVSLTDQTYIEATNVINIYQGNFNILYEVSAGITFFIVTFLQFFLFPFFDKRRRTPAKLIMGIEAISLNNNYENFTKKTFFPLYLLNALEMLAILLFIPSISLQFSGIFRLMPLLIVSGVSLIYGLISLIIAFGNSYNKSIKELITVSIIVDSKLMDDYFVARGYLND